MRALSHGPLAPSQLLPHAQKILQSDCLSNPISYNLLHPGPADRLAKAWARESARFERDYNDRLLGGMVVLRWGAGRWQRGARMGKAQS